MLTVAQHDRHDCPQCHGTWLKMISRDAAQIVARCMKCGSLLALERPVGIELEERDLWEMVAK